MSLAELKEIQKTVKSRLNERKASKMDIRQLRGENTESAKGLKKKIGKLGEILNSEMFEGRFDLGVDPEKIDWEQMPEPVRDIFQPEFSFQPEDITDFKITIGKEGYPGSADLDISLYRMNRPWIYVAAHSIVRRRPDHASGSISVSCQHSPSQVREGRVAMQALEKSFYVDDESLEKLVKDGDFKEAGQLVRSIRSLVLGGEILNFVVGQVDKRVNSLPETSQ